MNDTPLTDKSEQRVCQEYSLTGFCLAEDMQELELDRAKLLAVLNALLSYTLACEELLNAAKSELCTLAEETIAQMEKTQ